METRALAISLFYAVGTGVGGIAGPVLFGQFIHSGDVGQVALGFFIGAAAMALGGIAELAFGIRAEGRSLENIARPLTAEEAEAAPPASPPELPDGERAERIRRRAAGRRAYEAGGLRRVRPGPGATFYSPGYAGTAGTASRHAAMSDVELDGEIEALAWMLAERGGPIDRRELAEAVGGRYWGPRRFNSALRQAAREGRATRGAGRTYGPQPTRPRAPAVDGTDYSSDVKDRSKSES
jgi:hypothetical protein